MVVQGLKALPGEGVELPVVFEKALDLAPGRGACEGCLGFGNRRRRRVRRERHSHQALVYGPNQERLTARLAANQEGFGDAP